MKVLTTTVKNKGKSKLGLSYEEFLKLVARCELESANYHFVSYSRLCLFIGEAVHNRFSNNESEADDLRDTISRAANIYMT